MKALTWQGKRSVRVENVPATLVIQEPTDAIVRITSTAICGSDLHLYEVLGPYMHKGDVIGHEPMGIVEEVGSAVTNLRKGDRVVVPSTCLRSLLHVLAGLSPSARPRRSRKRFRRCPLWLLGALRFRPGGQAEFLRVPHAD